MEIKKRKNILVIGIITLVIVLLGSTYAFFMYSKTIKAFTLTSNSIKAEFESGTNSINIAYAYPISDAFAKQNLDKLGYLDFTVKGSVSDKKEAVTYEIYLTEDSNNTLDSNFIKVYLTDDNNQEVVEPSIYNDLKAPTLTSASDGKVILTKTETGTFESKYRIYAWIDQEYTQNVEHQTFSFKVNLYTYNDVAPKGAADTVKEAIASHTTESCQNLTIEEDGITYLSGSNECIDFNYVWYSGKLWRITAINPDGTMKMITQDVIATIPWNANNETYKDSWIYQWLNEDFKDTLYNYENIIVQNVKWNATEDENEIPGKPPTDDSADIVQGDVGSLNAYEYYQSYKNASISTGYLNIGYYWWLITPYRWCVWNVDEYGILSNDHHSYAFGVRPSVNLKSNIELNGEGTKSKPYTITIDKATGKSGELINTRISGEYVKVNGKDYRIVGIENGTTKLTSVDYVRDEENTVITKNFGQDTSWTTSVESGDENYWGAYLNNTWLTPELEKYITEGTYYLGTVGSSSSYKNSICSTSNTSEPTSSCEKTSSTWTGLVGLPRVGEMFSAQLGSGYRSSSDIWLINPQSSSFVRYVDYACFLREGSSSQGVRPSINLKSGVKITSGDGMSPVTAYNIALP